MAGFSGTGPAGRSLVATLSGRGKPLAGLHARPVAYNTERAAHAAGS